MQKLQIYKDTGWIIVDDALKYRVLNGVVTVIIFNIVLKGLGITGEWENIFTLPSKIRPNVVCAFTIGLNDGAPILGNGIVDTEGRIKCICRIEGSYIGCVTYPI